MQRFLLPNDDLDDNQIYEDEDFGKSEL